MSGGFGQASGLTFFDNFGGLTGIKAIPSNTTLTKGSWISVGTLNQGCAGFMLGIIYQNNGQADYACQVDVGIGASGSQIPLIANINMVGQPAGIDTANAFQQFIPISLPPGTQMWVRSAVRVANFTGSIECWIVPYDSTFCAAGTDFCGCDTIGSVSTGTGTAITAGTNQSGVKGSYVSMITSTIRDYGGFFLCFDLAHNATNESGNLIDIALGGSGSQKVILPDMFFYLGGVTADINLEFFPIAIPEGSQIWVRAANTAPATTLGMTFYGIY